eukprot:SAG11_NODE_770_length_7257_cov_2.448449_10_plen_91_part_00
MQVEVEKYNIKQLQVRALWFFAKSGSTHASSCRSRPIFCALTVIAILSVDLHLQLRRDLHKKIKDQLLNVISEQFAPGHVVRLLPSRAPM